MSELSGAVTRIGDAVGQLRDAKGVQMRVDQLKDKVDSFTSDVTPVIERFGPTAQALDIDKGRLHSEAAKTFDALDALRATVATGGLLEANPGLLMKVGRAVKEFGDHLRDASLEAWNDYKEQHLTLGAVALLAAAEAAGLEIPPTLKSSMVQVRGTITPTVDAITRAQSAVKQYESVRQQLTQGDPEIEHFLIDLTGHRGVPLEVLTRSEMLQRWLQDRNLYDSLAVVLGKANGG